MVIKNFEQKRGDTWPGFETLSVKKAGVLQSLTGASIRMQVRATRASTPMMDLQVGTGITIDASGDFCTVAPKIVDWAAGIYQWDLQIAFADGITVITPIGGAWVMQDDVTHA